MQEPTQSNITAGIEPLHVTTVDIEIKKEDIYQSCDSVADFTIATSRCSSFSSLDEETGGSNQGQDRSNRSLSQEKENGQKEIEEGESGEETRKRKWTSSALTTFVRFLYVSVALFICFCIIILIGAAVEKRYIDAAPSTTSYYQSDDVCSVDLGVEGIGLSADDFKTYPSIDLAHHEGNSVVHCGECGQCSTAHDIGIMVRTRESLTGTTKNCAKKSIFGGKGAVEICMAENVGLTPPCNDCWVDNIMCTKRHCAFTCIKSLYLVREKNNEDSGALNSCLECDEKMCGPQFIECSGANRRRLGIRSDIGRSEENEQCKTVDVDWTAEDIFQP